MKPLEWRRVLTPWWLVSHLVVLLVVVSFPQLGLWQLRRYDEVRQDRQNLEQRLAEEPVALTGPDTASYEDRDDAIEFTRVVVRGTWVPEETVAHRNRDLNTQGGFDLLTPLDLGNGFAVLVRRGFVPPARQGAAEPLEPEPLPDGEVEVVGWLEPSQPQPGFGATDPAEGVLETMFNADVPRIDRQTDLPLLQDIVHLQTADPPEPGAFPIPQPVPDLSDTSNLSYALQWFAFTAIAGIGYAVVLYRRLRGKDVPTA